MKAVLILVAALLATGCAAGREGWSYRPGTIGGDQRALALHGLPESEADFVVSCGRDNRISLTLVGADGVGQHAIRLSAGVISRAESIVVEADGAVVATSTLFATDPLVDGWLRTGRLTLSYEGARPFVISARGPVGRVLRTCRHV